MIVRFNRGEKLGISTRLKKIQDGDELEREAFIKEYNPFIIKSISKVTNTYVDLYNCEEYSIALIAFNYAIDNYENGKGSFLNFANLIIKNRLIDFIRKNKKINENNVPIDEVVIIEEDNSFINEISIRGEIERFIEKLKDFNITLEQLVQESPKHRSGRVRSIKIARYVIDREELKKNFYRLRRLPMKLLSEIFNITIKTLKRTRKFTIATAIIIDSNLSYLKRRINEIERGNQDV